MRVLVAGGAGFLGSHLCDFLVTRGDEVVVADNLSTGTIDNVKQLLHLDNVAFLEVDISRAFPNQGTFDAVVNLASPASPPAYLSRPLETLAVGSEGTRQLLEVADRFGARFIQASTSEIYGDPLIHPQREDYWGNVNPIGPRSVYDEAKRFGEALTMAYHRSRGTRVGIARIFNTYGPRLQANDGRVVSNFISQALHGDPLTIYGDGSQTRSLCYVSDLVEGLVNLLDSDMTGPINLGNPNELTVMEIARRIISLTKTKSRVEYLDGLVDDPSQRKPDITLAKQLLDWIPKVSLDEGLTKTIRHFQSA